MWNDSRMLLIQYRELTSPPTPQVSHIAWLKRTLAHCVHLQALKRKRNGLNKVKASGRISQSQTAFKGFSYAASVQIMNYPWLQNRSHAVAALHGILVCKIMRMIPQKYVCMHGWPGFSLYFLSTRQINSGACFLWQSIVFLNERSFILDRSIIAHKMCYIFIVCMCQCIFYPPYSCTHWDTTPAQ